MTDARAMNNAKEDSLQTLNNLMSMRWFVDTRASLRMMTEMYQSEEADEEYKRKG